MKARLPGAILILSLLGAAVAAPFAPPQKASPAPRQTRPASLANLPLPARAAVSAAIGADEPAYHFQALADGWQTRLAQQDGLVRLSSAGMTVSAGGVGFSLALEGLAGQPDNPVREGLHQAAANRIEARQGRLTEWYSNGPLGFEQGFTIEALAPENGPAGPGITLGFRLTGGLAVRVDADARGLTFLQEDGQALLQYGGLAAYDAAGKELPARLELADGASRLLLKVDDRGASYPINIDPWLQRASLTNSGMENGDQLGWALALSGDTLVASTPTLAGGGPVYVFQRAAGSPANPFIQAAKLTASDGVAQDFFGNSLAVSGDTVLVGAYNKNGGSAYVFVRPPGGWADGSETARLEPSDKVTAYRFGLSVAIDGDTAVVGASASNGAYVYVRPAGGWSGVLGESARLSASDVVLNDGFGGAAAISGSTILVGAYTKNSGQGAAYVFLKPALGWSGTLAQASKLTASDGQADDFFGTALAIDGDTAVVGAYGKDAFTGSAYIFARPPGGWSASQTESARLAASDGIAEVEYGRSVAIAGSTVVVGSTGGLVRKGQVYVYTRPAAGWSGLKAEDARLSASAGTAGDQFGFAAATDGATIIAGLPRFNDYRGGVDLFLRPAAGWSGVLTESNRLAVSAGAASDSFGYSVAVSGDTILVGAYGSENSTGAAYIFSKPAIGWSGAMTQAARLAPIQARAGNYFGFSVALDGDTAVVGSPGAPVGSHLYQGLACVFTRPPGGWAGTVSSTTTLHDANGGAGDSFGLSVAVSGPVVVVGAPDASPNGMAYAGAAFVFVRSGLTWLQVNSPAASLTRTDSAANDFFGSAVAIHNFTVAVSSPGAASGQGAAYVFIQPQAGWAGAQSQSARLVDGGGAAHDSFGTGLAVNNNTIFVGSQPSGSKKAGIAVFSMPLAGWTGTLYPGSFLSASDGQPGDGFSRSLAVEDDTLVAGAPMSTVNGQAGQGALYVFVKPPGGWTTATETAKLATQAGAAGDNLGYSVGISGGVIVGGAPYAAVGGHLQQGTAQVFGGLFLSYLPKVVH